MEFGGSEVIACNSKLMAALSAITVRQATPFVVPFATRVSEPQSDVAVRPVSDLIEQSYFAVQHGIVGDVRQVKRD
jgi:hypothetical protein